jgi:AraC-like DNA-binding protein
MDRPSRRAPVEETAPRLVTLHAGRVSIDEMAKSHGVSRQQFARRFRATAGLRPKLFARITRFQALVNALLSTDVSDWASVAPAIGFYDQAHMINEFRAFAGSPPTAFFQPHGICVNRENIQLRGRPCEWVRGPLASGRIGVL